MALEKKEKNLKKPLDKSLKTCYNTSTKNKESRKAHTKKGGISMTKKEMFAEIRKAVISNEEMVAFIDHEIELLNRKSGSPKKPTKTQVENDAYKATIVEYLTTVDAPKTIKEMQAEIADIAELTNQRITHMLTDLVKAGTLTKEYAKKTPYYSIAA